MSIYNNQWLALAVKKDSQLKSWSADLKEFGSIQTKSNKSDKPTPEYSLENSSRMVSSWRENKKFTQDLELDFIYKQKDSVDIPVPVKREVPEKAECQLKFSGSEDKESLEDSSESTELQRRSIELFITDSILLPRVTNSRTKPSWLKPSSSKKPRKSMLKSLKPNKKPEDKRTSKEEKEELTNQRDFDLLDYYLNLHFTIFLLYHLKHLFIE